MSQPRPNANTSRRQGQKQKQWGVRDGRLRKSKSREPLGNWPSSLSQTGSMRSQTTQSAPGPQQITTQLPVVKARDDEPEWDDAGEDSMNSQDADYDDDGSSEESMEEDAKDAKDDKDDLVVDYSAQRPIETEYELVESQPAVIFSRTRLPGDQTYELDCPDGQHLLPESAVLILQCSPTRLETPRPLDQVLSQRLQAPSQLQYIMSGLQVPS